MKLFHGVFRSYFQIPGHQLTDFEEVIMLRVKYGVESRTVKDQYHVRNFSELTRLYYKNIAFLKII